MTCAWQAYLNLLPPWLRQQVDKYGKDNLQELRLRIDLPPELISKDSSSWLDRKIAMEDLKFCINAASQYSPWCANTISNGYITAPGGHRIGICGEAVVSKGVMTGIHTPNSLCIRVARDFPGVAKSTLKYAGSILIIGRPGSGKTTLLRDIIRQRSENRVGAIAVVDERREIFPMYHGRNCFFAGRQTDIISAAKKNVAIDAVLRNMSPSTIAMDEITAKEDCDALLHAGWCGVHLLATAHAGSRKDLFSRPVYRPIIESKLFDTLIILQSDKSWHVERMET